MKELKRTYLFQSVFAYLLTQINECQQTKTKK